MNLRPSGYEPVDTPSNTADRRRLTTVNILTERYSCQRVVPSVRLCQVVGLQSGFSHQSDIVEWAPPTPATLRSQRRISRDVNLNVTGNPPSRSICCRRAPLSVVAARSSAPLGYTLHVRKSTLVAVIISVTISACSPALAPSSDSPKPTSSTATSTTITTSTPGHTPVWLTVKYRSDTVDVAHSRFAYVDGGSSSLVGAAFYDASNGYMIVLLNGTAYHYCNMPSTLWLGFSSAVSLGSFYNADIKGRFDCRTGNIPEY